MDMERGATGRVAEDAVVAPPLSGAGGAQAPRPPAGTALGGALASHPRAVSWVAHGLVTVGAILAFVFALRTLVLSAHALSPLLDALGADGALNLLGFGWLGSYVLLSGSPVAALALTLQDAGVISATEAFAQIVGSRMGASFVVLLVGFVYFLRGRRLPDSVHVGVVAFLVTVTTYTPIGLLGLAALHWGWFDGIEVGAIAPALTLMQEAYDPLLAPLADALPDALLFVGGLLVMLVAFKLFDSVLPTPERTSDRLARRGAALQRPWPMFLLGAAVTLATLSVAISLTLLVPLSMRGTVRRDAVVPYVLGANITTLVDTLVAASLLESGRTGTVVVTALILAAAVGLAILAFAYRPYARLILRASRRVSRDMRSLTLFLALVFGVPLLLTLV